MMGNAIQYINNTLHKLLGSNYHESILTLVLFLVITIIYSVIAYWIKRSTWSIDKKRRATTNSRNSLVLMFLIGVIFLWSGEIKTMIFSITALAAALLIAFKEMILCFLGSFLIASNKLFSLGEYIEIDGIRGKVIDKNLIYTKLIIYEPFQTREMNIPNIIFVTNKMVNLSHYGHFQSYILKLSTPNFSEIAIFADEVKNLVDKVLLKHQEKFSKYFSEKKLNDIFFDVPKNYYYIDYDLSDNRNGIILLHYLSHPLDKTDIENEILNGYSLKLKEEYLNKTQSQKEI